MSIGSLGAPELIVILLIVILLFGATRIPALGAALGSGIRRFREGLGSKGSDDDSRSS
jgi:sec-independent protein translocase protein TatA